MQGRRERNLEHEWILPSANQGHVIWPKGNKTMVVNMTGLKRKTKKIVACCLYLLPASYDRSQRS